MQGGERVVSLTDFEEAVRQGLILAETPMRMGPEDPWRCARDFPIFHATLDSPELRLRRAWEARRVPWMTALIVGLCIRMHLWLWGTTAGEQVWGWGTRWWPAVAEKGESWRLLSYGFLHANVAHITMNLLFVAYAGVALENMFGSGGLLLLFVAGVWGGGLFSSMLDPSSKAVGASAGDFALLGASVLFGWRHADIIPARAKPAFGAVILLFTLQALFGSLGEEGVDWQAHLGGAIFGGIFGSLLVPTALAHAEGRNRWVHGIFWSLVLASLVGLWAAAPVGLRWSTLSEGGIATVRPLWWEVGWTPYSASGWVSPTGEGSLVIETTEQEKYWSLAEEEAALRARLTELDPQATLTAQPAAKAVSGVEGTRLDGSYRWEGQSWTLQGWMGVRGGYRYRVLAEGVDPTLVQQLEQRVMAELQLPVPEELAKAREAWRPGLRQIGLELAAEERRFGNPVAALAVLQTLLPEAVKDRQLARDLLDELLLLKQGGDDWAEDIAAAFPEDRKIQLRFILLLKARGSRERAATLLEIAQQRWPEDRALNALGPPPPPGD